MKKFMRSMLSPQGEISLGSTCIFIMVMAYTVIMVCAFFMQKKLPLTGLEFASIIAAVYGIKKAGTVAEGYYQSKVAGGGKNVAGISD
jgi:hypothetical protein